MREAAFFGMQPAAFWDLTYVELMNFLHGAVNRDRFQFKQERWLIWHGEALQRQKKLMSLERFISDEQSGSRRLTPEEAKERRAEFRELKSRMMKGAR